MAPSIPPLVLPWQRSATTGISKRSSPVRFAWLISVPFLDSDTSTSITHGTLHAFHAMFALTLDHRPKPFLPIGPPPVSPRSWVGSARQYRGRCRSRGRAAARGLGHRDCRRLRNGSRRRRPGGRDPARWTRQLEHAKSGPGRWEPPSVHHIVDPATGCSSSRTGGWCQRSVRVASTPTHCRPPPWSGEIRLSSDFALSVRPSVLCAMTGRSSPSAVGPTRNGHELHLPLVRHPGQRHRRPGAAHAHHGPRTRHHEPAPGREIGRVLRNRRSTAAFRSWPWCSWLSTCSRASSTPTSIIGWLAVVVPFASPYSRFWVGLGTVALDLMIAVFVSSLLRTRLRPGTWRGIHWLAYGSWPIALAHTFGLGTDAGEQWVIVLGALCLVAVGVSLAWRMRAAATANDGGFRRRPSQPIPPTATSGDEHGRASRCP